jgi:hypothetical protein
MDARAQVAAPAQAAAPATATGTWKVDGDVQGTPVRLTCVLEEKEHKLSGTCAGAGEDTTPRKVTGDVTDKGLTWQFDSEYQGGAITISLSGTVNADGTKINGTMAVAPMGVDGTFQAVKQ